MNRYPLWKNATVLIALLLGFLYTLPNFFGEAPAVQVASVKSTHKVDARLMGQVEAALKAAAVVPQGIVLELNSVRVRLADTDNQLRAKDVIEKALNPDPADAAYSVALNLISNSPSWLSSMRALPMYLGLDLRGGVHFLLQADMEGALKKRLDSTAADLRSFLRDKNIRHGGIQREGKDIVIRFREGELREKAMLAITASEPDLQLSEAVDANGDLKLMATMKPAAQKAFRDEAIKQNILTLHKRINELGVAEPVIQQQGADRIVVQLPGVQDVALAKSLIGRTATLEVRMVDAENVSGEASPGSEIVPERKRDGTTIKVAVKKLVVLTGDRFVGAQATFDQDQRPA
ncbi:MAG: protein translocase subunit SecD, partial [Betaproteobacteria bacterium]|nr:protein translocase subunit SecD [Betaproteobacteria bacterium]